MLISLIFQFKFISNHLDNRKTTTTRGFASRSMAGTRRSIEVSGGTWRTARFERTFKKRRLKFDVSAGYLKCLQRCLIGINAGDIDAFLVAPSTEYVVVL